MVVYFSTATKPRSRGASWSIIAPPFIPLSAIVQFDIQSIYAQMFERGLWTRTIEYTNAVLQSAFRQAVRWKMLGEDPRGHRASLPGWTPSTSACGATGLRETTSASVSDSLPQHHLPAA